MKAKDLIILLLLIGLLILLQLGVGVTDNLRWDIPGLTTNTYKIDNQCDADILFETVNGDQWLRVSHELTRKFDPVTDFQIKRYDNERMVIQINEITLRGRVIGIRLDQYTPPVLLTTCIDQK